MSRVRTNFLSGNVDNAPLAVGDQTLESADLADLPEITSPDVAALVLGPLTDTPEIVHVTAHSAGATTATILRAQEGSGESEWAQGTGWDHTPTADDYGSAFINDDVNARIVPNETGYGWVVGSDQYDEFQEDPNNPVNDYRAFLDLGNGAFRAGVTRDSAAWDSANRGSASSAGGFNTEASGSASHAEGQSTRATNTAAHVEGNFAEASGEVSHAEGDGTTASGNYSHAEGLGTVASGSASHAEGDGTSAMDSYAHAEGWDTIADYAGHAEGRLSEAGAWGHAEGQLSKTQEWYGHAEGLGAVTTRRTQDSKAGGYFDGPGDAQFSRLVVRAETTDATSTILGAETSANYEWNLEADRAYNVKIQAIAQRQDAEGEVAGWTWEGVVARDNSGGSRVVGTPVEQGWADTAADPWTLDVAINADVLELTATGESGKTIRWVATLYITEVG